MMPYAVEQGLITSEQVLTFKRVESLVGTMPDGLSCYEVCQRVAGNCKNLEHWRGKFNGWDHSWLVFSGTRVVLDPHPWASGSGPMMVDCRTGSPWAMLYRGGPISETKVVRFRKDRPQGCGVLSKDLECNGCGLKVYGREVEDVCPYRINFFQGGGR